MNQNQLYIERQSVRFNERTYDMPYTLEMYILLEFFRRQEIVLKESDRELVPRWVRDVEALLEDKKEVMNYCNHQLTKEEAILDGVAYYFEPALRILKGIKRSNISVVMHDLPKSLTSRIEQMLKFSETLNEMPMNHIRVVIGDTAEILLLDFSAPCWEERTVKLPQGKHLIQIYGYIRGSAWRQSANDALSPWIRLHRDGIEVISNKPISVSILLMRDIDQSLSFKLVKRHTLERLLAVEKLEVSKCLI